MRSVSRGVFYFVPILGIFITVVFHATNVVAMHETQHHSLSAPEIVQKARNAVVELKRVKEDLFSKETSIGSGVIIDTRGYIITNDHVIASVVINNVKRESIVLVTFPNGKIVEGAIIGRNSEIDLALVKIPADQCGNFCRTAIPFGDSDAVRAGEPIIVIGHPLNFEGTVSHGIISFERREAGKYNLDSSEDELFIQTDAAISFGSSGGVALNERGEMIGIVKSTSVQHGLRLNIGFLIPSNRIKVFLSGFLGDERTVTPKTNSGWIGIEGGTISFERYEQIGHHAVTLNSIVIRSVAQGGPAAQAGLRPDDIIVGVEGKDFFRDEFEFDRYIKSHVPGSVIIFYVFDAKNRAPRSVAIAIKEKPAVGAAQNNTLLLEEKRNDAALGIKIELLADHPDVLASNKLTGPQHFFIAHVASKSPAESAGLQKGDIIVGYDGKSINDWEKEGFLGKKGFEDYLTTRAGDVISIALFHKNGKPDIITVKLK